MIENILCAAVGLMLIAALCGYVGAKVERKIKKGARKL